VGARRVSSLADGSGCSMSTARSPSGTRSPATDEHCPLCLGFCTACPVTPPCTALHAARDHQGIARLQAARSKSLARCPIAAGSGHPVASAPGLRDPVASTSRLSDRVLAAHAARSGAGVDRRRDVLEPRRRLNGSVVDGGRGAIEGARRLLI
jgi:hypothetical protein